MIKPWILRFSVLAALALAATALKLTILAPDPIAVAVFPVAKGKVEETVTNSRAGTVRARRRAKLSPEIGGMVSSLPFAKGNWVKEGQVLLRLNDEQQRAELALAERELQAATAQQEQACLAAERAARDMARIVRLAEDEIASRDLLDRATTEAAASKAACQAAEAHVKRAEAAVSLARTLLEKTTLCAPFDGIVAELEAEVGEWVSPSPPALPIPPVIDILDPGSTYISAPMDEVDSARIHPGQVARVSVDSHRGKHFSGKVSRVAPYVLDIEAQNRTVEIEVELDDNAITRKLLPGTSADVEVILEEREDVLRIPTPALLEGDRVLLVDGERLVAREIRVGLKNWDFTEVVEGLGRGEQVVVSLDRPGVEPGARVIIDNVASGS